MRGLKKNSNPFFLRSLCCAQSICGESNEGMAGKEELPARASRTRRTRRASPHRGLRGIAGLRPCAFALTRLPRSAPLKPEPITAAGVPAPLRGPDCGVAHGFKRDVPSTIPLRSLRSLSSLQMYHALSQPAGFQRSATSTLPPRPASSAPSSNVFRSISSSSAFGEKQAK